MDGEHNRGERREGVYQPTTPYDYERLPQVQEPMPERVGIRVDTEPAAAERAWLASLERIGASGCIEGTVLRADGSGAEGVPVSVRVGDAEARTTTGRDGRWRLASASVPERRIWPAEQVPTTPLASINASRRAAGMPELEWGTPASVCQPPVRMGWRERLWRWVLGR